MEIAMGELFPTLGSKIFIGGILPAKQSDYAQADFASQTWAEIGWLENLGQIGDESADVPFDSINRERTYHNKGTRNAGTQDLVFGLDPADPGQVALIAAEKTRYNYAIKVELNDTPDGVGATPSQRLYIAQVAMARTQLDTANNVTRLLSRLIINSNIVPVAADDGA
jgi:hypothetical protein